MMMVIILLAANDGAFREENLWHTLQHNDGALEQIQFDAETEERVLEIPACSSQCNQDPFTAMI